ncbi:MAG: LysM peptidoglycan-binding domain-containing protein [Thermomicrobiales bacterium]
MQSATSTATGDVSVLPGTGVVTVSARATDTLVSIADKFDVSVSSLLWSNDVGDPTASLGEGTLIRVPREDGVIHEVEADDTLESIAGQYGVEAEAITAYEPNEIERDSDLNAGDLVLVPGGTVADRGTLDDYVVGEGDTVTKIASYYGLQPQTIVWANELPDPSLIHNGQTLVIPPGDGALITVSEGDTVEAIADRFGIDPDEIYAYEFNDLGGDAVLQVGQQILVPGDFLPPLPEDSSLDTYDAGENVDGPATGTFIWPTEGWTSQEFHTGHLGVDIANEAWTPVNAMDGGVVIFAGWSDYGLGYTVGIDHGNGFQTWYGHFAAQPYVEVGQIIWQGGYLGPMGSTGRSTGPHLHLVVLEDGIYVNPLDYLQ